MTKEPYENHQYCLTENLDTKLPQGLDLVGTSRDFAHKVDVDDDY